MSKDRELANHLPDRENYTRHTKPQQHFDPLDEGEVPAKSFPAVRLVLNDDHAGNQTDHRHQKDED